MGILSWLIFGLIVGLLARAIMPGRDPMGLLATTVLGMIGALVAGWLGTAIGWYERDSGAGLIAATIGAIIVLGIYNGIRRARLKRATTTSVHPDKKDRFAA